MEIGSSGAGSVAQIVPTQTGSQQQVVQAESKQQQVAQSPSESQQSSESSNERVGSVVDIQV